MHAITLILLAVTVVKSALQSQWGSNESDEFGRKVDKDGNVVYGRRLIGLDDDDDGNLRSYPTWIAKHYGWMLYLLAFSYTLLGFRVLCSDCQKENVFLKGLGRRRVRFDVLVAEGKLTTLGFSTMGPKTKWTCRSTRKSSI